jgi:MFS family permease
MSRNHARRSGGRVEVGLKTRTIRKHSVFAALVALAAVAAGTLIGGPIGDRFGRRYVI